MKLLSVDIDKKNYCDHVDYVKEHITDMSNEYDVQMLFFRSFVSFHSHRRRSFLFFFLNINFLWKMPKAEIIRMTTVQKFEFLDSYLQLLLVEKVE